MLKEMAPAACLRHRPIDVGGFQPCPRCLRPGANYDEGITLSEEIGKLVANLIGRAGGTTPSSSWQEYRTTLSLSPPRLRTTRSSRSARSSTGPTSRFGATTGRPFKQPPRLPSNGTRIALGFAGNSTFRSPPRSYVAEWWFFSTAVSAADRESCMPTKRPSSACHSGHRLVI